MNTPALIAIAFASGLAAGPVLSADAANKIAPMIESVQVVHNGQPVTIHRGHNPQAELPEIFRKTERGCPPFCVQPMVAVPGVDTIGELEILEYLHANGNRWNGHHRIRADHFGVSGIAFGGFR